MDEQNKTLSASESNASGKQDHHRRHHSKHRHNGGQKPNDSANRTVQSNGEGQPQQQGNPSGQAPANSSNPPKNKGQQEQNKQQNHPHGDNRPQKNYDRHRNDRNGEKNNRNGSDQKKRRPQNGGNIHTRRGPEDLYGRPTENDVLTMDELRAKIVLKTADGSIPAQAVETSAKKEADQQETVTAASELLFPMDEDPAPAAPTEDRVEVVGIRFRASGKVYYFDPKKSKLKRGQFAIVETARGPEFGEVTFGNRMVRKSATVSPLRPVLRAATEADIARNEENLRKEKEALEICRKKILEHRLEMKLIDVQYAFDNSKLLFYFTSEGRVDFRELVKDLASVFRTRIELRQIGIRDEAKILGGLGVCGRPLCCTTFLSDFVQVSIKMAKEQGLSLNSAKISGACGRLMCCLRYESDVYAEEIRCTPPIDSTVNTPDGVGTVIGMSPLAGTVKVLLKNATDTPPKQYRRDEVTVLGRDKTAPKAADQAADKTSEDNK